jgi:fucose permease
VGQAAAQQRRFAVVGKAFTRAEMTGHPTLSRVLLVLAFIGFISLGLPDGLLGVGWPSIRESFGLPIDAIGAWFIMQTAGYVMASFASGWLLNRMRVGTLLAASCLMTSASLLWIGGAPSWSWMVAAGVLAGFGAGAIDAGINTFAATYYSARTVNLLHGFFGVGAASGPMIMSAVLASGSPWQRGYFIVGFVQLALSVCFALTRRRWPSVQAHAENTGNVPPATLLDTLRVRSMQISIAVFMFYVGLESTSGVWIYSLLFKGRGVPATIAATAVSSFWIGLTGSRILFGFITAGKFDRVLSMLIGGTLVGAALLLADMGTAFNLVAAAILGFSAGPIFPLLIATTPARLGSAHTANAVGIQIASASVGLSGIPSLVGVLADKFGYEAIPASLLTLALALAVMHRWLARTSRLH